VHEIEPGKTVLVASDVHLGATSMIQQEAFLRWLEQAAAAAPHIVLNGDLFNFWFEYRWGHTQGHDAVLELLREIIDGGVRVTMMGGNHDWWGGSVLRDEIGIDLYDEPVVVELAGLRTLLAHGDGLGRGDLRYRVARVILRGRPTRLAFGLLPPRFGDRVAGVISKTDGRWAPPGPSELARSAALERWALGALESQPDLDLVLLGHTHVPVIVDSGSGRWYINTGDWVHHRSYAVLREGEDPRLTEWDGTIS
jgi:UDP-2,3-diacylglucosamine hydrolase